MAIMTGVKSAQVLGPTTQKQADKSRQAIQGVDENDEAFDAASNFQQSNREFGETDGGREEVETQNGLDVVRTE
jgi:cell division protein FtsZ